MVIGSSEKIVADQSDETKKVCALVVDNDPTVRRIHEMLLSRHGLKVEAAENGKEAVDLFFGGKSFDLATQELRATGVSSMIVGVTACKVEAEKQAFMEACLDYCWEKPLNGGAVISMLHELAKKLL
ncbi:hypothetical protein BUALT_Bualt09G0025000 [Buddleja alternifolia]|uniref:Response regulatory domain-containing protein n=1 Tax=Buddleja alternifolia TaxID=168488 RepID=A0AAV6X7X7_9LAMI|nr:hypothetical protein BUALT_Bualt09G0025000 [Buddleja alternifolia]